MYGLTIKYIDHFFKYSKQLLHSFSPSGVAHRKWLTTNSGTNFFALLKVNETAYYETDGIHVITMIEIWTLGEMVNLQKVNLPTSKCVHRMTQRLWLTLSAISLFGSWPWILVSLSLPLSLSLSDLDLKAANWTGQNNSLLLLKLFRQDDGGVGVANVVLKRPKNSTWRHLKHSPWKLWEMVYLWCWYQLIHIVTISSDS